MAVKTIAEVGLRRLIEKMKSQYTEALAIHNTGPTTHPDIRAEQIIQNTKLKLLEDTVFSSGIQDNRTIVAFSSFDSVELIQGNYNALLQRIEC